MIRPAIIAILACFYVALSVWLVGKQGQAYREGLRRDRMAAAGDEKPAQSQAEIKKTVPAAAAAEVASSPPEAPPAVAVVAPTTTARAPDQSRPPPTAVGHSDTKAAASTVDERAPDRSSEKSADTADPLAGNPLWIQPAMMRNWDVANLSAADEQKLGAQLHDVIVGLNPVAAAGPWQQRLEDAAKPFLATLTRKDIRYTFEIMESDQVNAFSHPGGYVYVNRGLFDLIGEDEDYALQFAVGTEIAHVDLRHAIKCLQDPDIKNMSGGTIRKLYWLIIPFGYLVSAEVNQDFEADDWTFMRMRGFGRTKRETLAFLYKLDGYATKKGFRDGRAKVRMAADSSSFLDIHYRRQTAAWRRLDHLKEKIK
jgi:Peptidase family M48